MKATASTPTLAVGYGLGNGFRFEIEGDFAQTDVRNLLGTPFPTASKGNIANYGADGQRVL